MKYVYDALWIIGFWCTCAVVAFAQVGPAPGVQLNDEGAVQGRVQILNCTGAGISCSASGVTGMLNATGGGPGSANVAEATVDFGATGKTKAVVVVTGQAWVTASSVIVCSPTMMATADRTDGMEDAIIEGLTVSAYARVVGTGFTVAASPARGMAFKKYLIHCTGA